MLGMDGQAAVMLAARAGQSATAAMADTVRPRRRLERKCETYRQGHYPVQRKTKAAAHDANIPTSPTIEPWGRGASTRDSLFRHGYQVARRRKARHRIKIRADAHQADPSFPNSTWCRRGYVPRHHVVPGLRILRAVAGEPGGRHRSCNDELRDGSAHGRARRRSRRRERFARPGSASVVPGVRLPELSRAEASAARRRRRLTPGSRPAA